MITRFAPSPTGPLHLGHAYSALLAHDLALKADGQFHLRIEDIDTARSRPEWEDAIYKDLHWLGIGWETPVMRQSDRAAAYADAIQTLWDQGLFYRCTCTRKDISEAMSAPQSSRDGPDGPVYPGTCRGRNLPDLGQGFAIRLNMKKAVQGIGTLSYNESGTEATTRIEFQANNMIEQTGDIVLARRDIGTSYHLAVAVDDAAQQITDVVRGRDLAPVTPIHVLLQRLLGLPTPTYHHHRLICDETGKRLAKRDEARAIAKYLAEGTTPAEVRKMVGL